MNEKYILFAIKDARRFYIANTEPFIWAPEMKDAKVYSSRFGAEYDILRKYENYMSIYNQLRSRVINSVHVAKIVNNKEVESYRIL